MMYGAECKDMKGNTRYGRKPKWKRSKQEYQHKDKSVMENEGK